MNTFADHQSGKGYKVISKLFGVHHSTEGKIIHKWKTFKTAFNLPRSERPSKFTPRSDCAMLRETIKIQVCVLSQKTTSNKNLIMSWKQQNMQNYFNKITFLSLSVLSKLFLCMRVYDKHTV